MAICVSTFLLQECISHGMFCLIKIISLSPLLLQAHPSLLGNTSSLQLPYISPVHSDGPSRQLSTNSTRPSSPIPFEPTTPLISSFSSHINSIPGPTSHSSTPTSIILEPTHDLGSPIDSSRVHSSSPSSESPLLSSHLPPQSTPCKPKSNLTNTFPKSKLTTPFPGLYPTPMLLSLLFLTNPPSLLRLRNFPNGDM